MSNLLIELNNRVCYKCLRGEHKKLNTYIMYGRGYGSEFDGINSTLQLCDCCDDERLEEWFNEKCKLDKSEEYYEIYKHENNIKEWIEKQLSVYGQELFYNRSDKNGITLDPSEWIRELD